MEGGVKIKYLFWNIYKKNLVGPVIQLILENNIDIVALAEAERLDTASVLRILKQQGILWKSVEVDAGMDIRLFVKNDLDISVHREEKRFSSYKIYTGELMYLLHVVHFSSPVRQEESIRSDKAINISRMLRKTEEGLFKNEEFKSMIVGDFNLQPYARGISGVHGFNATMSEGKARKKFRIVDGELKYFYFNPIWKLMGDHRIVQGTYYNNYDQQGKSIFWYSFDQLLIRPFFIDKFNWDFFEIVERTESFQFIKNEIIDKNQYSDHLPLKFEIY